MRIDLEQAIRIYAKACQSWYGGKASKVALGKAQELRARGDEEGFVVWRRLALELEHQAEEARPH